MDKSVTSGILARPGLDDIGFYMVGISRLPGFDRIIKLSSNESPLGPSPAALEAAKDALADSHRYPELGLEVLPNALADLFNLDPKKITFSPGSDEILLRLINSYSGPGDEVIHSEHAYMQFPIYAIRAGSKPVAAADDDFKHSVDNILACVTKRTKIVIVANPDNPSGTYLPGSEIRRLRNGLRNDILLIIDAAYDEYANASDYESATKMVGEYDNVVVTRTFSKLFGLAGLRLGWCYAPHEIVDLMERIGPSFPVNVAAQAAGIAAAQDRDHSKKVLEHNRKWIDRFSAACSEVGIKAYPSQTNFVLTQFPETAGKTAAEADAFLHTKGIVGRKFALDDFKNKLRFTMGLDDEMEKLIAALKTFMSG